MNSLFKSLLILLVFCCSFSAVQAQKIGFYDNTQVMSEMAEVKAMQSQLNDLKAQLEKQFQEKYGEFNKIQEDAGKRKQEGTLPPLEEEQILKDLQERQQSLIKMEQDMQKRLVEKEEELFQPILDKVNKAIEEVAKEKGFNYILNSTVLLYSDGSSDVTEEVKAKL